MKAKATTMWRSRMRTPACFGTRARACPHSMHRSSQLSLGTRTRSLLGFRRRESAFGTYKSPYLQWVQAVSFSPFKENALIAAGGGKVRVSVFPAAPNGQGLEVTPPLVSFRACHDTISSLSLNLSMTSGKTLLLSAGKQEGAVKLWDLSQRTTEIGKEPTLILSQQLHSRGIYGMDTRGNEVLTCSVDATIVVSSLREGDTSLDVSRRYTDHVDLIRCVRYSPFKQSTFASGGKDRVLRVYDIREAAARACQEIANAQTAAINSISWHPFQEHTLLTAGMDSAMHLYDLRHPSKTFLVMNTAHTPLFNTDCSMPHNPCFVAGGEYIVSTGSTDQDRKISLHRTLDGRKISLGDLGARAAYMVVDPFADRLLLAFRSRLQSFDFQWQEADNSVVV